MSKQHTLTRIKPELELVAGGFFSAGAAPAGTRGQLEAKGSAVGRSIWVPCQNLLHDSLNAVFILLQHVRVIVLLEGRIVVVHVLHHHAESRRPCQGRVACNTGGGTVVVSEQRRMLKSWV